MSQNNPKLKTKTEVFEHKCKIVSCAYSWISKKEKPKACPYCKSYKWNESK